MRSFVGILVVFFLNTNGVTANAGISETSVVATVGSEKITVSQFQASFRAELRQKFYHGSVSPEKKIALRQEVLADMVDNKLLLQEAIKRDLAPDESWIKSEIQQWKKRIEARGWQSESDVWLKSVAQELKEKSLIEQLSLKIKDGVVAKESDVLRYYEQNADKFTTPEQFHISLILLKVAPSSKGEVWDAAFSKVESLVSEVKGGASFADIARRDSNHESASSGGDLGYIHKGMLAPQAQKVLDGLVHGAVSKPVVLLQGVAIMKLLDKRSSKLNKFVDVKERASDLWLREHRALAYREFINKLRTATPVTTNEVVLASIE